MAITSTSFNIKSASQVSGVSERQLRYWDSTGLLRPSVQAAKGRGSRRLYSFEDLLELRVIQRLLEAGVSLHRVRRVAEYLRKHHADLRRPLVQARLVTDGATVFKITDGSVEDTLRAGQTVMLVVDLELVWNETQSSVVRLSDEKAIEVRLDGRTYAVTLTPDLEDGGWVADCPSLPGCASQGDTLAEAKRMIREAISAWLAAAGHEGEVGRGGIAKRSRR